ncbi:MAG: hypothetical protein ACREMA_00215 [Longimicrobiales bacterium]
MRRFVCLCLTAALVGCGGASDQASTSADSAAMAPVAPAGIALADVAGTWNVEVRPEASDSVLLTYQLTATADQNGWSIKLPDRAELIPVHVGTVQGDSIVVHAGPYSSALRKGVTVSTEGVSRLQNGMLVGTTTARYSAGPDSVVKLRTQGTRVQ